MGACGLRATDLDDGDFGDLTDGGETDGETTAPADGGTTGEDACLPAYDEPPGSETVITLRNDTADVLFVGIGGCTLVPFAMFDAADASVGWQSSDCAISCEDVLVDQCFYCGPCEGPSLLRLAPGESWDRTWSGRRFDQVDFPSGCVDQPCEPTCERAALAEAGAYTLRAQARLDCGAADPSACECPDGAGTCALVVTGGELLPATHEATAALVHPSATAELVFE